MTVPLLVDAHYVCKMQMMSVTSFCDVHTHLGCRTLLCQLGTLRSLTQLSLHGHTFVVHLGFPLYGEWLSWQQHGAFERSGTGLFGNELQPFQAAFLKARSCGYLGQSIWRNSREWSPIYFRYGRKALELVHRFKYL